MDVQKCLDILSARVETKHTHEGDDEHHHTACVEENASRCLDLKVDDALNPALEPELETMSVRELVTTFRSCQEQRVHVYQQFEKGFLEHMFTDSLPQFSQNITKQFASISNQINAIESSLRTRQVPLSIPSIMRKVQGEEKEKLLLTSALLLEKMRLKRQVSTNPDDSSVSLFESSIESMQSTHTAIIERINDLLTDLLYEMEDFQD
ncbi:hypothetical protein H310_05786 [Aphanomyces invadans]|uniref:Uncharacterized protein n=1 Tax=Aphanomyces invadans TaxID=157072 RepID=A0A024U724_9STRA|nr:hypothetical protein H310_05786 [Aphanomyces invadans]ETW02226.1 hypothetical protein H310_05786 [Aphanomyces invadans]|eukprot:XP_008868831.1 hypothetical protein H310_05786 [Aphanomyces invadans]